VQLRHVDRASDSKQRCFVPAAVLDPSPEAGNQPQPALADCRVSSISRWNDALRGRILIACAPQLTQASHLADVRPRNQPKHRFHVASQIGEADSNFRPRQPVMRMTSLIKSLLPGEDRLDDCADLWLHSVGFESLCTPFQLSPKRQEPEIDQHCRHDKARCKQNLPQRPGSRVIESVPRRRFRI
jgi:hypothetical protein